MSAGFDRRTFLRRAGLVATGAAATGGVLAACSGKSPTTTFDSVIDHPAKESGIDTVVVLTMENRSFDHMLGWLGTDAGYLDLARRRHGSRFRVDGRQDLRYRDPKGRTFPTSLLTTNPLEPDPWRGCTHPIPGHGWNSGRAQLAGGFLGARTGNDEYAIGYFDGDDVPFTRELAQRFTVFVLIYDEWGGFFDHVPPPVVPDDRRSPDSEQDFGRTGFRVRRSWRRRVRSVLGVDHTVSDHTSVLRFLEWRFLGAPGRGPGGDSRWWLTRRDRHAHNLGASLGVGKPDPDLAFDVDLALAPGGPACAPSTIGGTPPPPGSALGDSSEWQADQELQSLTRPVVPDVNAAPWLLP